MVKKYFLNPLKRAAKWYFNKASETYAWLPSGMIPFIYSK